MILRKSIFISFSKLSNLITEEIIMFKKILSLAIVAMMLMSLIAVGASAAQVEVAEEAAAADDVASQGAEAEVAATGDGTIYFDAASAGWSGAKAISFYIYEIGGANVTEWGSKNKSLTSNDGDIWAFDAAGAGVQDGKEYGIIFNNLDTTAQTADLLFNTSCYGDTGYVPNPDAKIENAVDSNKSSMIAKWKNSSLGPIKQITSLGHIVGESIPSTTTAYQMMVNFLASKGSQSLTNALNYDTAGKGAQKIIDEVAADLGLTQADVTKAIAEAKDTGTNDGTGDKTDWSDKWDASKSSLPAGGSGGSTSGDTSSKSSSGSSSTSTSSKTSTTTSTSSKSGSASNTQTGQEENILFIMLGVMVLAAGVIFFVRKKERA